MIFDKIDTEYNRKRVKAVIYQIDPYDAKGIVNSAKVLVNEANGEMSLETAILAVMQFDRLTHIYNELERTANLLTSPAQSEKEKYFKKLAECYKM